MFFVCKQSKKLKLKAVIQINSFFLFINFYLYDNPRWDSKK